MANNKKYVSIINDGNEDIYIKDSEARELISQLPSNIVTRSNNTALGSGEIIVGDGTTTVKTSSKTLTTTAPTSSSDNSTIPTSAAVWLAIENGIATNDAMVYKSTIAGGNTGSYGALTPTANKGWTYKVTTAGKINGISVEVGDMLICNTDNTAAATSIDYDTIVLNWDFIQTNIDGAVTGPTSSTDEHIATFNGTTGKIIKDSGFTIGKSVPSDAVFTDTTYSTFVKSGSSAAAGLVPRPSTTAGTTKFLREDCTWAEPSISTTGETGTKVYLDENSGSLTTAMLTSSNVVYVISYDYTISGTVTVPSDCAFEFAGGSISGGTLTFTNTYLYGNIKFGADITISGTISNEDVCQSWFASSNINAFARLLNNLDGYVNANFSEGDYTLTTSILIQDKDVLNIHGNGCRITSTLSLPFRIIGDSSEISTTGAVTFSPVGMGARTITVSDASGFSVGDTLHIFDYTAYSFSNFRNYYRQGEIVEIQAISDNTITLSQPIYGYYVNEGSLYVLKRHFTKCSIIDNLTIYDNKTNSGAIALFFKNLVGAEIRNVNVEGAEIGLYLVNCHRCTVENGKYVCTRVADDCYGIDITASQNIIIKNCRVTGRQHGFVVGTAGITVNVPVVNRFITIESCNLYISTYGYASINFHGYSEYCTVQNCYTSRIALSGNHTKALNNVCVGDPNNNFGGISVKNELTGLDHVIDGNRIFDGYIYAFSGVLEPLYLSSSIYTTNKHVTDEQVRITNNVVELSTKKDYLLYGGTDSDTIKTNEDIVKPHFTPTLFKRSCYIANNKFKTIYTESGYNLIVFDSYAAHGVDVIFDGNEFTTYQFRLRDNTRSYTFKNNIFNCPQDGFYMVVSNANTVTVKDNIFYGENTDILRILNIGSSSANIGSVFVERNKVVKNNYNTDAYLVRLNQGAAGKVYVTDNRYVLSGNDNTLGIGVNMDSGFTAGLMCIENNYAVNESKPVTIEHSLKGTITNFVYGDQTLDTSWWANATITNTTIRNKAYEKVYNSSTLCDASGKDLAVKDTVSSTVAITTDTSSSCSITGSINSGKSEIIIYTNSSGSDKVVTVPTTYTTPDGAAIELTCPDGGYCEINYLNIEGTIYARGL